MFLNSQTTTKWSSQSFSNSNRQVSCRSASYSTDWLDTDRKTNPFTGKIHYALKSITSSLKSVNITGNYSVKNTHKKICLQKDATVPWPSDWTTLAQTLETLPPSTQAPSTSGSPTQRPTLRSVSSQQSTANPDASQTTGSTTQNTMTPDAGAAEEQKAESESTFSSMSISMECNNDVVQKIT